MPYTVHAMAFAPTIRRPRQARGQVMVIVVLAILLLVGMIFYIMNVGEQVNRRVVAQNAADSAAMSGAIHMARCMNTVAMNNIAISRELSLVPIMDALPLSLQMAYEEVSAWSDGLNQPWDVLLPRDAIHDEMCAGLQALQGRLAGQKEIIEPVNAFFNGGYDISYKTVYSLRGVGGPPPHGSFWVAAKDLYDLNRATVASAGVATQINAARYGRASQADSAFVAPVVPVLPARQGRWEDWYIDPRPNARDTVLRHGRPPDDYRPGRSPGDNLPHRLGGYNKLLGWRVPVYEYEYGDPEYRQGSGGARRGIRNPRAGGRTVGGTGIGSGQGSGYHRPVTGRRVIGYRTYGPYEWMRDRLQHYWWHNLRDTNLHDYHGRIAQTKLNYMFVSPTIEKVHYPQWVTDFPTARSLVIGGARVSYTMFCLVTIRSRYPDDDPLFMSPGSYASNADEPQTIRDAGWNDPAGWGVPMIAPYVWEEKSQYETTQDLEIGIVQPGPTAPSTPGGPMPPQQWFPVYVIDRYVFVGADFGGEWPVTNPANFDWGAALPVPYLLDTRAGDYEAAADELQHDRGVRREQFTYLGVARRSATPSVWPQRFGTDNPLGGIVAVAQAEIYNPSSWDLWTQNWRAQMVPVTRMDDWTARMERGTLDLGQVQTAIDGRSFREILDYFQRFEPRLLDEGIQH